MTTYLTAGGAEHFTVPEDGSTSAALEISQIVRGYSTQVTEERSRVVFEDVSELENQARLQPTSTRYLKPGTLYPYA